MSFIKIFFAHVPKTAGTSFRNSLQDYYGEEHMLCDYGPKAIKTSTEILDCYTAGFDRLPEILRDFDKTVISAHCHDTKLGLLGYKKMFPSAHLVTFLRDPVSRIVSEYYHFKNHLNYEGRFIDFVRNPFFVNRQSKALGGVPLVSFHFIGLTEIYPESVNVFNSMYDTNIEIYHANKRDTISDPRADINAEDVEEFCRLNIIDITIYNQALVQSYRLMRKSILVEPSVRYMGSINMTKSGKITGWAVDYLSTAPIDIVFKSTNRKKIISACLFRKDLVSLGMHKSGYAGFSINYDELRKELGLGEICVNMINGFNLGKI